MVDALGEPIRQRHVGIVFGSDDNPHIQRTGFREPEDQIARLADDFEWSCAYPRSTILSESVDAAQFNSEPYKLALALGEPQLAYRAFDLSVLEFYRNDPRYLYHANDMSGRICIADEHFQTGTVPESDEILLESFGFAYDDDMNRAVHTKRPSVNTHPINRIGLNSMRSSSDKTMASTKGSMPERSVPEKSVSASEDAQDV